MATPSEQFENATAVFVGTVKNISADGYDNIVDFDVSESQKGSSAKNISVTTSQQGASCGFDFEEGREYIVYAYDENGNLGTGMCSGTSLITEAQNDIDQPNVANSSTEPAMEMRERKSYRWLQTFNDSYSGAVQALTPFILAIVSFVYYKLIKERELKEGDAASEVGSVFWTFGRRLKILAVHQYEKSDDVSGYRHLGQNSRPDQWEKIISIQSSFCNLKHKIVPKNKDDVLTVIISRNGKEKWKVMSFNK